MAKKTVKPTPSEQAIIDRRLRRKYPQMFKPNWTTDLKKKVGVEFKTKRTKQVEDELRKSGLTEADIKRLRSKKK